MVFELEEVLDEKYKHSLDDVRCAGIDIGSRSSKIVLLYNGKLYTQITPSGVSSKETSRQLLKDVLEQAGVTEEDLEGIVGTGYGGVVIDVKKTRLHTVTEITCHAMGAHYLHAATRTLVDIGGQDSKAVKLNPVDGRVIDFIMNDRCAAGTGRFLEKVAQLLEYDLDEIGEAALQSENPAEISSQCVVFAESEVISLRANNVKREDIANGIHLATARRIKGLLKRTGFETDILFTGGVSNNKGMRKALEVTIGEKLADTRLDTVYAGALGGAIYAHLLNE